MADDAAVVEVAARMLYPVPPRPQGLTLGERALRRGQGKRLLELMREAELDQLELPDGPIEISALLVAERLVLAGRVDRFLACLYTLDSESPWTPEGAALVEDFLRGVGYPERQTVFALLCGCCYDLVTRMWPLLRELARDIRPASDEGEAASA